LPVCETALGVVDVRLIASASRRIRVALLGAEDLAADLAAERTAAGTELAHARARFLIDCRAARIEPIDAPYTFSDIEGAVGEAKASRAMGYRSKAVVRPDHAIPLNQAFTPNVSEVETARRRIAAFEAARAKDEDRALVDGHWIEVPTYRAALRLLELADRYGN
jgi:citrate lyase subunit beta/citryl-CoA lyase